ncbi:5'/3'-nucleotidase SurE [Selenomonas sp. TAMA-11512]|uniref:5'/3'-nucleotidase SurE n=1 Tax=Selenomonas sp. TAMA-11512 TaxID=3095337 RepID=UPI003092E8C7|nr:5'/3'-nucleotidase SurE [Selenomonas sp. TAMA-11512]
MRVLLTNDDGIEADGIEALVAALASSHKIVVAAPTREMSGMSHAITVGKPLSVTHCAYLEEAYGVETYCIDGTPADCVMLYLEAIADTKPDLVISGINHGSNLGTDVLYSGTVNAAMEGYLHDIPAIAVSLEERSEIPFAEAANIIRATLPGWLDVDETPFYNVNFPRQFSGGIPSFSYSRIGRRDYINAFNRYEEDDGRLYYVMAGEIDDDHSDAMSDLVAVKNGYISVTPLMTDLTDHILLDTFQRNV